MTLVVKLGSSIVAGDDGALRGDVLDDVCAQVAELHEGGEEVVMVTSGAIARGIRLMGLGARPGAIDELQAASAVGQGSLFRAYEERLAARDVRAAQVLLTAFDMSERMHYLNARQTLQRLLAWHVVPVINENDTTATDEITFGDNDFLSAQVAIMIEARRLVLLTNTGGPLHGRPGRDESAELIAEVTDFDALERLRDRHAHLEVRLRRDAQQGRRGRDGERRRDPGHDLRRHQRRQPAPGSRRRARSGRASSRTRGARPASSSGSATRRPLAGRIEVDEGAARMLREGGASLLPVGVIGVDGEFAAGDPVEVVHDGEVVGKGVAEHSAAVIGRLRGLKSAEVGEVIGDGAEEAVHRDRFVLL